jgi:4-amino-4-deoxy-L-arabinose transferase-like glycosyltransferase
LPKARALLASPVAMVAAGFAIRILYLLLVFNGQPVPAENRYVIGGEVGSIAAALATGHGFSSPLSTESGPTAWSTPVFPLLLAACFKVFGVFSFKASAAIRLLDVLFSSATSYPIALLGRRLFRNAVGTAAGWCWALFPKAIFFSVVWVWDTSLAALLLAFCVLATYALEERPNKKSWIGYGALWGCATLVNAALLVVFPGCLLFAAAKLRERGLRRLQLPAIALLGLGLVLSPWVARNQLVFHGQVLLRSNFGLELWLGNNPEVPVSWSWWLHPTESAKEKEDFLRLGEVAYMQEKKAAAIEFIETHPADTLRFQYHRFMETWTGFGEPFLDIWRGAKATLRAELALNYALTVLMLFGLLGARRSLSLESLPLLNAIALFPVVYYVTHTTPRYRHPIDPLIVVLAAYAVVSGARRISERIGFLRAGGELIASPPA